MEIEASMVGPSEGRGSGMADLAMDGENEAFGGGRNLARRIWPWKVHKAPARKEDQNKQPNETNI